MACCPSTSEVFSCSGWPGPLPCSDPVSSPSPSSLPLSSSHTGLWAVSSPVSCMAHPVTSGLWLIVTFSDVCLMISLCKIIAVHCHCVSLTLFSLSAHTNTRHIMYSFIYCMFPLTRMQASPWDRKCWLFFFYLLKLFNLYCIFFPYHLVPLCILSNF